MYGAVGSDAHARGNEGWRSSNCCCVDDDDVDWSVKAEEDDKAEEARQAGIQRCEHSCFSCCYNCGEADEAEARTFGQSSYFSYYFYHPWARLFVAFTVMWCNFLIYGEDPVTHSRAEAEVPVLGEMIGWVQPPHTNGSFWRRPSVLPLRLVIWVVVVAVFAVLGRLLHHLVLRGVCRLSLFGWRHTDADDVSPGCRWAGGRCNQFSCQKERWQWPFDEKHINAHVHDQVDDRNAADCRAFQFERRRRVGLWKGKGHSHVHGPHLDADYLPTMYNGYQEGYDCVAEWNWHAYEYDALHTKYEATGQTSCETTCWCCCWPRKHREHNKGTWFVMILVALIGWYIYCLVWNGYIRSDEDPLLYPYTGIDCILFGKIAATFAWLGDGLTFFMVLDGLLQELTVHWANVRESVENSEEEVAKAIKDNKRARPALIAADAQIVQDPAGADIDATVSAVAKAAATSSRRFKLGYLNSPLLQCLASGWDKESCLPCCGPNRVVALWVILGLGSVIVVSICFELPFFFFSWDDFADDVGIHGSTEMGRAWLCSLICVLDVLVVAQDWEFPSFDSPMGLAMPGTTESSIDLKIDQRILKVLSSKEEGAKRLDTNDGESKTKEQFLERYGDDGNELWDHAKVTEVRKRRPLCQIYITGKWLSYAIFFIVCIVDIMALKALVYYIPEENGQYVNPYNKEVCSTHDRTFAFNLVNQFKLNIEALEGTGQERSNYRIDTSIFDSRIKDGHLKCNIWNDVDHKWQPYLGAGAADGAQFECSRVSGDTTDFCLPDRQYHQHPDLWLKLAFVPVLLAWVFFGILLWYHNKVDQHITESMDEIHNRNSPAQSRKGSPRRRRSGDPAALLPPVQNPAAVKVMVAAAEALSPARDRDSPS